LVDFKIAGRLLVVLLLRLNVLQLLRVVSCYYQTIQQRILLFSTLHTTWNLNQPFYFASVTTRVQRNKNMAKLQAGYLFPEVSCFLLSFFMHTI
jgi:hypothetical protein